MNQEQMWRELAALPPHAQQQVLDFIAFLRSRYIQAKAGEDQLLTDLHSEPFIGMWRDREEMENSSAWVRTIREQEWS